MGCVSLEDGLLACGNTLLENNFRKSAGWSVCVYYFPFHTVSAGFMNSYTIKKVPGPPPFPFLRSSPPWDAAPDLTIGNFLKESSSHRPIIVVRLLYDDVTVFVLFLVKDRYVRSIRTGFQSEVWKDSCVEWFVQPKPEKGYFNFEVNAGGALRVSYVEDPERINGGLKKSTPLPIDLCRRVKICHSLPEVVDPEMTDPVEWMVGISVPLSTMENFIGRIGDCSGQRWRANFNKCADETSHPHWATWNPVAEKNFHRPQDFGEIVFGRRL
jgi:hypothetical protein